MLNLVGDIPGHKADVKSVSCYNLGNRCIIATASRDSYVKVWELKGQPSDLAEVLSHNEHSSFVNAVDVGKISLSQEDDALCVISGGTEGIVYVWDVNHNKLLGTLLGHTSNICFLKMFDNVIYSCSWDKTIRVWQGLHCLQVLTGHDEAVWSCCSISDGHLLSASADKTIRLWKDGICVKIYNGHTDVVRSVISLDDSLEELGDFASCGNDGYYSETLPKRDWLIRYTRNIKFWKLSGECTLSLKAHDSFIYTIKVFRNHLFSAGEDRTLKVWHWSKSRGIECIQAISLPVVSIWALDCTAAGEVVCGCSDGRVYLFSPHRALESTSNTSKEFQSRLHNFQVSKAVTGDHEVLCMEDLLKPGKKAGETKLIRVGDVTEAHQWDGAKWDKIGDVVEGPARNEKVMYDGREYDYVFDVEIDEGGARIKLPFNNGENPYTIAARFIAENNLRPELADQIVEFIVKNTSARTIGTEGELFNPYLTPEHKPKTQNDHRYLEANILGIMKKLEEFAIMEGDTEMTASMGLLKEMLSDKVKPSIDPKAIVGVLVRTIDNWEPEHLFPVYDAIRVLQLKKVPMTSEQVTSISASSYRASSAGPALLTLGRLIYNLLCDQEYYSNLIETIGTLQVLVEACYSANLKEKTLPSRLLTGIAAQLSAQSEEAATKTSQAILPLLLTKLRVSADLEELCYLVRSLKDIFPILGLRDRKTVLTELELKQLSLDVGTEIAALIQAMRRLNKV